MNKKYRSLRQYIFENYYEIEPTDDFLEATAPSIWFIVHSFNSLDEEINSCIFSIINDRTDEIGATVIYNMSFSAKVDLFKRLIISMESACGEEMPLSKKLIENLKKCAILRNAVIHAECENIDNDGYTNVKLASTKKGFQ